MWILDTPGHKLATKAMLEMQGLLPKSHYFRSKGLITANGSNYSITSNSSASSGELDDSRFRNSIALHSHGSRRLMSPTTSGFESSDGEHDGVGAGGSVHRGPRRHGHVPRGISALAPPPRRLAPVDVHPGRVDAEQIPPRRPAQKLLERGAHPTDLLLLPDGGVVVRRVGAVLGVVDRHVHLVAHRTARRCRVDTSVQVVRWTVRVVRILEWRLQLGLRPSVLQRGFDRVVLAAIVAVVVVSR